MSTEVANIGNSFSRHVNAGLYSYLASTGMLTATFVTAALPLVYGDVIRAAAEANAIGPIVGTAGLLCHAMPIYACAVALPKHVKKIGDYFNSHSGATLGSTLAIATPVPAFVAMHALSA